MNLQSPQAGDVGSFFVIAITLLKKVKFSARDYVWRLPVDDWKDLNIVCQLHVSSILLQEAQQRAYDAKVSQLKQSAVQKKQQQEEQWQRRASIVNNVSKATQVPYYSNDCSSLDGFLEAVPCS